MPLEHHSDPCAATGMSSPYSPRPPVRWPVRHSAFRIPHSELLIPVHLDHQLLFPDATIDTRPLHDEMSTIRPNAALHIGAEPPALTWCAWMHPDSFGNKRNNAAGPLTCSVAVGESPWRPR